MIASPLRAPSLVGAAGVALIMFTSRFIPSVSAPGGGVRVGNLSLIVMTALLWSPSTVLWGAGVGLWLGSLLVSRDELWRASINAAMLAVPAAAAAVAAAAIARGLVSGYAMLIATGVSVVAVYRVLNMGLFSAYRATRFGHRFWSDWLSNTIRDWQSQLLSAPLPILLAALARLRPDPWSRLGLTGIVAVTLPFARQELAQYVRRERMNEQVIDAIVASLDRIERGMRDHGERVSRLAAKAGERLRMTPRAVEALRLAGRLHDLGRALGGRRAADERTVAAQILERFPDPLVTAIVLDHHRRWDDLIARRDAARPAVLGAQIVGAAEMYDEVRRASTHHEAAARLQQQAGGLFDPAVVRVVVAAAEAPDQ